MDKLDIIAYISQWVELHAQEVYGSPRQYVNIRELNGELSTLKDRLSEETW